MADIWWKMIFLHSKALKKGRGGGWWQTWSFSLIEKFSVNHWRMAPLTTAVWSRKWTKLKSVCLLEDGLKHSIKVQRSTEVKRCYNNWELSLAEIHCIQTCFVGSGSTTEFNSFYLWGCKTNKRRSEVRGGEGRACLLAWSSLASHPLASCQLCCPSPSLSPLRQTGCQCRGSQHAPQNKHTHCQFLLSPYLSICRLSVSQV